VPAARPRPGGALRRAAPRLSVAALAVFAACLSPGGSTWGVPESVLDWLWLPLAIAAVPSSPKRWWRYVKEGKPEARRVTHGGTARLFVTDPGRNHVLVAALLREHGPLDLGDAVRRLADASRPVWDDLTEDSARELSAVLEGAGATVRIDAGP